MILGRLLAVLALWLPSAALPQDVAPDQLVKTLTSEVLTAVKQEKPAPQLSKKIADVVETKVVPHFNFARMAQIALAVNWRRATPEQQKQLVDEFRNLLVRTYSNALALYRDQTIEFRPTRTRAEDKDVTVRSEVRGRGREPIAIDYDMEKTAEGWKVYDVKVGGVSLISTYRDEFAAQVREVGIDGLIKTLASKNRQLEAKGRT
jgi:phospholipid transport system substrate-binding protein